MEIGKAIEVEYPLTQDQQRIFDLVETTNANILIVGKPGVGKSVLIRALRDQGSKRYTLAAPTGIAATNIGGRTLHSIFSIPSSQGIIQPDFNRFTTNENVRRHLTFGLKALIIDEISMVRCDVLDFIDRELRYFRQNDLPFGGVQIIAVGDFFQLPPIVKSDERKLMRELGWNSEFAFDAKSFQSFAPVILDEVLRQKGDKGFITLLHSARVGDVTEKQVALLNKRVKPCSDLRIRLTGRNADAEAINLRHLNDLPGPSKEFHANSFGNWPEFPAETVLELRVGAQVLVKKNGADRPPGTRGKVESKVVNGTIGVVAELPEPAEDGIKKVIIRLKNDELVPIYWTRWERKIKEKIGDEWTERVVAGFEQIPLQLAWAISMHKSQGQTFDSVHINANAIFAPGQLYVALSRSRSLEGISLEFPVTANKFWTNRRVLEFTETIS